jgi:predicted membrane protein
MVRILGDTDLELSDFEVEDKTIVSVLGDTSIDLSGLQPEYGTVGIRMMSVLGDVTLVVPIGTDVIRDASLILGDFKIRVGGKRGKRRGKKRQAASDDDELAPRTRDRFPAGAAPKVRISGFSLLGDVTIVEV